MGGNRKERRAAGQASSQTPARSTGSAFQPTSEMDEKDVDFILQHPDRSGPKGKTLFDLADERQRELNKGKPGREQMDGEGATADGEAIGPLGDAILYSVTMAGLHLTLDVLVYNQYREAIVWDEIIKRAASALPIFFFLVYLTHVGFTTRFPVLRNLLFLVGGVAAGCYLVFSGNKHGYFYVMKAAPPVGTLWIWSVVEMDIAYAALHALAVLGYSKWNGLDLY
ncbi:hypothetical protein P280DRAFT_10450 [Massarina eburnea CBS 473.64]|uniref:DUF7719 domain-containing protein n=1 Tax=Massarina eburnea CBS 473.64 TaxID=1395130 RepID=A0A6A6SHE0_9PLEO|nr:hypothetical protein P280DRAFT_10450 [Massarina eburnea CBS 473.64]